MESNIDSLINEEIENDKDKDIFNSLGKMMIKI